MEEFISVATVAFQLITTGTMPILVYLLSRKTGHISLVKDKFEISEKLLSTDNPWLVEQTYRDLNGCNIDYRIFKKLAEGPGADKRLRLYNEGSAIFITKDEKVELIFPLKLVKFLRFVCFSIYILMSLSTLGVLYLLSTQNLYTWVLCSLLLVFSYVFIKLYDVCHGGVKTHEFFE